MKKFVVRCLLLSFVCSFILTPTLVQAVVKTSTVVFYPQSVREFAYMDNASDSIFMFQNKVIAVDYRNNLKATTDGETWDKIGKTETGFNRVYSNGKQIVAQNGYNKSMVSDDGKTWEPCGVKQGLFRIESQDIFVTYANWEFQYSNDGRQWHTVNLHNSAIETDENFTSENKGKKSYAEFKTIFKLNGRYYMFTDKGASIVSNDMQNWSVNSPKLDWVDEYAEFNITLNGTCIIYRSWQQVRISMDGTNWKKIAASGGVEWDGEKFIDVLEKENKMYIQISNDGLTWKILKEIELKHDYYNSANIIVSEGQSIIQIVGQSMIESNRVDRNENHNFLVKDDICEYLGEMPWAIPGSAFFKLDNQNIIIYRDFSTLVQYNTANVKINNKELNTAQSPIIYKGRTLVPLRTIFEELGLTVAWDGKTQTVTGTKEGKTITLQIGNPKATVNGKEVTLDVSAKIINSRTLVPARFIAESLGCDVQWDSASNTVNITSK
ncbi:MAG: hypothetical protein H7Y41_01145 [Hyphomonadaceae bacterium]|nr:hypothetical protein [Clostridia bacterium]